MKAIQTELDLSRFPMDAVPYLEQAAQAVHRAETEVGSLIWLAGQALSFAAEHCSRGQWPEFCRQVGISETRALQYRHVYERFKHDELPQVGKQLLIELAAPSTPASVVEAVAERVQAGEAPPTVRELADEIKTAQAPAQFNHDVDRTRLAPDPELASGIEAVERAVASIRKAVTKAVAICGQIKQERAWLLLQHEIETMLQDVKNA